MAISLTTTQRKFKSRITSLCEAWVVTAERGRENLSKIAFGIVATISLCDRAFAQAGGGAPAIQGGADPATMILNICDFILGPFGQTLAVLGIVAIGLSWMFGRASLGLVAGIIGGIVIMFGASALGKILTGNGG